MSNEKGQNPKLKQRNVVVLNGNDLTIEEVVAIGKGERQVALEPQSLKKCQASREFLEQEVKAGRIIYGVNTSFGPMCNKIIHDDETQTLQVNLIRSHAAGLGDPLPDDIALAVLAVRLNSLIKGYSGVRVELLELMAEMINLRVAPFIPECGSVGASGDLVHLAHVGLNLIGEGKVFYRKELRKTADVFKEVGLKPFVLSFKEGLAIMNGTSAMTAIASFALRGAKKLITIACVNAAFAMEIFGGIDDGFEEDLHLLKPHPGQVKAAAIIRRLYRGSKNITLREDMHELIRKQRTEDPVYETDINVQDVYSIRCTPQILAPVLEAVDAAMQVVTIEVNSSNDNPIIIPEKKKVIHGGNFHGQSIAFAMDMLSLAICQLGILSERRLNKLLDKNLNEGLPEHLIVGKVGLTMGFMGVQYLATSTAAENKHLANPVSSLSISCNASNQDVVSMGTIAARKALKAVTNAMHILTVETMADIQALSFRNASTLGGAMTKIYHVLRGHFSGYDNTKVFHDELILFRQILFSSDIFENLEKYYD